MDWEALIKTLVLCSISVIIEAISATKEATRWFGQLKRPRYSFSIKVWYLVGVLYYIIFAIVAYRQFTNHRSVLSTPIILVALIMLINGASNFIIFKYRSLKWFYFIVYPFGILLLLLIMILFPDDKISALLATTYFIWILYDLYYGYHTWKLNG